MSRKPYLQWLDEQDEATYNKQAKKALEERAKKLDGTGGKRARTYKQGKKRAYKRMRRAGGIRGGGGAIVYPNVIGRGPYHLTGGVEWGSPDSWFRGKLGGAITSSDYVSGRGPYTVRKNSLISSLNLGQSPPKVMNVGREAFVLRHREYIGDLHSGTGTPTDFKLSSFALNPGNESLFPFAGVIAQRFQEYEIIGMLVELKSLSAEFSTNLSLGSMFMAADYNVLGPSPTTKQQLENMEYSSSCKPSSSLVMPIECDPRNTSNTHLYIATNSDYDGGDKRLYDWCNIHIGTLGIPQANAPIAEIWISYEIALYKPILTEDHTSGGITSWHLAFSGASSVGGNALGTTVDITGSSQFDRDENQINFPQDTEATYLVVLSWVGEETASVTYPTLEFDGSLSQIATAWATDLGNYTGQGAEGDLGSITSDRLLLTTIVRMSRPVGGQPFQGSMTVTPAGPFPDNNFGDVIITELAKEASTAI